MKLIITITRKKKFLFEFSFPKQNSFVILLLSILPNIPSLLFSDGTGIRSQIFGNISSIFAIFLMIFRSCITMILAKNEENPWSTCLLLKTHFPWVLENEKYLHQQRSYVDFCILWKQSFKVLIESQALFNLKQKKNKACYQGKNLVQMNMKKF